MRHLAKVAAAATLLFASTVASAQGNDEALARFDRGVQLYEAQNFDGALVEFNAAYKLSGNYKLLYNIGICQQQTKDYVAAAETFRRYLKDGGAEVSAERKADVEDRLSKLSLSVARIRVQTDAPQGTPILVDDKPIATIPIGEPVTVKIGKRTFSLTVNGSKVSKTVDVISGDNQPVSLMMSDATGGAVPVTNPQPTQPQQPPPKVDDGPSFPWPLWAITALLGGGATVTGILAVNQRNDFEKEQAKFGADQSTLEDKRSNAQTLGIVTDVLLVGTVISAGISTYLTIRWAGAPKTEKAAAANGFYVTPVSAGWARSF